MRRYLDVLGVDNDGVIVLELGHNLNRCEGGLTSARRVEGRDSYKTVNAVLTLKVSVCVDTLDHNGRRLDACRISVKPVDELHVIAVSLTPSGIETVEHRCPVLRLCSARTGVEGEYRVILIVRTREENLDSLLLGLGLDECGLGDDLVNRVLIAGLNSHLAERLGVLELGYKSLVALYLVLELLYLLQLLRGLLGIVPEILNHGLTLKISGALLCLFYSQLVAKLLNYRVELAKFSFRFFKRNYHLKNLPNLFIPYYFTTKNIKSK